MPPSSPALWKRFKCECSNGFYKFRCHKAMKSCKDHWENGARKSEVYQILDKSNISYDVYCHFDRALNVAWTLGQSYGFDKGAKMRSLMAEQEKGNAGGTNFWDEYRLSMPKMESIQQRSTKWRITCQYKHLGNKSDYVYGLKAEIDSLRANKGCKRVEYINVFEETCSNCTVFLHQDRQNMLHHYRHHRKGPCDYTVTQWPSASCKASYYFGNYSCLNKYHACSESPSATTQTWLGGKISFDGLEEN